MMVAHATGGQAILAALVGYQGQARNRAWQAQLFEEQETGA